MINRLVSEIVSGFQSGNLPQTVLLYGPYGAGQHTIIEQVVEQVVSQGMSSPDVMTIRRPEGKTRVSIAQVHQAKDFLSRSPLVGSVKILIVFDADFLGVEGQNAFLKSIEEPHPSSRIFLVSSYRRLLPTILSRCYQQEVIAANWKRPDIDIDWSHALEEYLQTITGPIHTRVTYSEKILEFDDIAELETQFVLWETVHSWLILAHTDHPRYTNYKNECSDLVANVLDQLASAPVRELYRWMSVLEDTKRAVLFTNSRNQTALESFLVTI